MVTVITIERGEERMVTVTVTGCTISDNDNDIDREWEREGW